MWIFSYLCVVSECWTFRWMCFLHLWVSPENRGIMFFHGICAHLQGFVVWLLCTYFKLLIFISFSDFNFHPTKLFVLLIQLKVPFIWCVQYFRNPDNLAPEGSSSNTGNFAFYLINETGRSQGHVKKGLHKSVHQPFWYLLTPCLLLHQLLQLWRLERTQKKTLNQQMKEISKWNIP